MSEIPHLKLSQLTQQIEAVVNQAFQDQYWIVAEISSHKFYPNSDRHYFDFVEKVDRSGSEVAKVKGIAWQSGSENIKRFEQVTGQTFTNGIEVLVNVQVRFHAIYGLQLIVKDIDPSFTMGNLEQQRRATLEKLVRDNPGIVEFENNEYLTSNKRISLRPVLQKIAIVGSPNSEGFADFVHTIDNNQYEYKFISDIYQSSVQGLDAEKELVRTLIRIYESQIDYDCVVIIRGGGAKTDFLVFDSYNVSRAVAKFPIPIITGIGHLKDVSIVDMMAHTSTKTPTKAAEFIISHNRAFEEKLLVLQKGIVIKTQQQLSLYLQKINTINNTIVNKSRNLISFHKDKQVEFHQVITIKTQQQLSASLQKITAFNSAIVNKSRTIINLQKDRQVQMHSVIANKSKDILNAHHRMLVQVSGKISSNPRIIVSNKLRDLENLQNNVRSFSVKYLSNQQSNLTHFVSVIRLMSTDSILKRGFALVSQNGKVLRDADSISVGSEITVKLGDTELNNKVLTKKKTDESEFEL